MGKILIIGYPYWAGVACGMLRRGGLEADVWGVGPNNVPACLRWCRPLRRVWYLMDRPFREAAAIHYVGTVTSRLFLRIAKGLGKRIVLHWVGTDVLALQEAVAAGGAGILRFYQKAPDFHYADSPDLVTELAGLGIQAELFRLLPDAVEARPLPMPQTPGVLCYWASARRAFYRGDIADALADEFADMMFYVVGSDGAGEPQHPNMRYLGYLPNLDEVWPRVSVFVRMPEHDSLSAMVLEALARGRWAIYSKPFPHTEIASNLEDARRALRGCLAREGANAAGQAYVREHFSPQAEAQRIAPMYHRILTV
jgi:hypothetical protein